MRASQRKWRRKESFQENEELEMDEIVFPFLLPPPDSPPSVPLPLFLLTVKIVEEWRCFSKVLIFGKIKWVKFYPLLYYSKEN